MTAYRIRTITAPSSFNTFGEAFRILLVTQAVALAIPLCVPVFAVDNAVYLLSIPLWIGGALLASRLARSPIPKNDLQRREEGWILVRHTGQAVRSRLKYGLALSLGNLMSGLLVGLTMLLYPNARAEVFNLDYFGLMFPYAPKSPLSVNLPWAEIKLVYAGLVLFFACLSIPPAWNLHREIQVTDQKWAKPKHYDAVAFARKGKILLGQEFERTMETRATAHKREEGKVEAEIAARVTEQRVGRNGPFFLDLLRAVNQHMYAFGGSGFGKTWLARAFIARLWNALRIPSLCLDWKGDYSELIRHIGGVVWTAGEDFSVNPLKLEGLSPSARSEVAAEILISTTKLTALQAGDAVKVMHELYRERGIVDENTQAENEAKKPPTVLDLITRLEEKVERGAYRGEEANNMRWAIRKLRLVERVYKAEDVDFFDTVLKVPTAINLSRLVGSDIAKNLIINSVLQRLYEKCEGMNFSDLRLMVIMDEAHLVLKQETDDKIKVVMEPLAVRLVREGRKYGFGIFMLSQLGTDVREEAAANVAFVCGFYLGTPKQMSVAENWIKMSPTEKVIYESLPRGGFFLKEMGTPYPHLIRAQELGEDEIAYAWSVTRAVMGNSRKVAKSPNPKPNLKIERLIPRARGLKQCRICGHGHATEIHHLFAPKSPKPTPKPSGLKHWYHEAIGKPETPAVAEPKPEPSEPLPKPASEPKSSREPELTALEAGLIRALELKPTTLKTLQAQFPKVTYDELLTTLNGLEDEGRIQVARVPNLEGRSAVYYGALKPEWLQSESLQHRAMQDMAIEALAHLRAARYINADYPDIGLELAQPKAALEFETGQKKLTADELDKWAANVKARNLRLGYLRTIVVVPNVRVLKKYEGCCEKYGLELTTIAKLLSLLQSTPI